MMGFMINHNVAVPKPPFFGNRLLNNISFSQVLPFFQQAHLYQFFWGFKPSDELQANAILESIIGQNEKEKVLQLQVLYGYYPCQSEGDALIVYRDERGDVEADRFVFPRQKDDQKLCLSDYFMPKSSGKLDVIVFQLVTAGSKASHFVHELFQQDNYTQYFYWRGFVVASVLALSEFAHHLVRAELGLFKDEDSDLNSIVSEQYRGRRFSFGYPACPNLADQTKILMLLKAEKIGVSLSETHQLYPEETTLGMIVHHPQVKYFTMI